MFWKDNNDTSDERQCLERAHRNRYASFPYDSPTKEQIAVRRRVNMLFCSICYPVGMWMTFYPVQITRKLSTIMGFVPTSVANTDVAGTLIPGLAVGFRWVGTLLFS